MIILLPKASHIITPATIHILYQKDYFIVIISLFHTHIHTGFQLVHCSLSGQ